MKGIYLYRYNNVYNDRKIRPGFCIGERIFVVSSTNKSQTILEAEYNDQKVHLKEAPLPHKLKRYTQGDIGVLKIRDEDLHKLQSIVDCDEYIFDLIPTT
jgi:hypothetical protein